MCAFNRKTITFNGKAIQSNRENGASGKISTSDRKFTHENNEKMNLKRTMKPQTSDKSRFSDIEKGTPTLSKSAFRFGFTYQKRYTCAEGALAKRW